jgi:TM2 domain-containing membrane protein YozV
MSKTANPSRRGKSGNVIAALASFFIPGLGQLVQGRILWAAFFFVTTATLYFTSFLVITLAFALIFHLWSIINAATFKG